MSKYDFSTAKHQLEVAEQHLGWYEDIKQRIYHENDESKQLHDAINALRVAVGSIVSQIEKNSE